jgi:ABC-2 type transport system permease protein
MVRKSNRSSDLVRLFLSLGILGLVGVLASLSYVRLDLTSEKRHSLTQASKQLLDTLDDQVLVKCYFTGEFPARYKRLEKSIREKLDEFSERSDGKLSYEFIDPYESADEETAAEIEKSLYEQGLRFTRIAYEGEGVKNFRNIWPAAIISYKGREIPVQFLKSDNPEMPDEMINGSINTLEYELLSKLRILMRKEKPRVAFLEGHGELSELETRSFADALRDFYQVSRVRLDEKVNALCEKVAGVKYRVPKFEALIIAKPDSAFSDKDKLIVDQFIMNGGKVLWLVDPIITDLDSLRQQQQTIGVSNENKLYDFLFNYGARLNRNIVIDRSCALIAFDTGPMGNQRNMQFFNWYFSPLVMPADSAHPIVNNLDPILFEFASSIDTVGADPSIRKTILLSSSYYSREFKAPVRINSGIVNIDPNFREYNLPFQPMAVLLEGKFRSAFDGRLTAEALGDKELGYRSEGQENKMIVLADGDVIRNKVVDNSGEPFVLELGYDRYAGRVIYDNKEFLLNSMNYLLDDAALISVRSRTIELRKLDAERIIFERSRWQSINMILPLLIVASLGTIQWWFRRRKFKQAFAANS